ncbi:winged helix-turn-helix domain-containing protein [Streptomyces griseorubiginosus]|uniref:winged helix-turn-helix domain-containing protein n=1 Tax=Streptomyces griseorubiginosus TaxID=67304 RepID=UPI003325D1A3
MPARRGPRQLGLTPAEYRLLDHLLVNAERVLSKEQISRYVWGEYRANPTIENSFPTCDTRWTEKGPRSSTPAGASAIGSAAPLGEALPKARRRRPRAAPPTHDE